MAEIEIIRGKDNGNPPDTLAQMYPKVNRNFSRLNSEAATERQERIAGDASLDQRISNIIAQSGTSDTEVVDARQPETGPPYPVLGDRLNAVDAQLAELTANVRTFGAKGDWNGSTGTNDVAAFQAAIDSLPDGGIVFVPVGRYLLDGTGTELLLITKPIRFVGCGLYSRLMIPPSVPAETTSVIRIAPTVGKGGENYGVENIVIMPTNWTGTGGSYGGLHGLHLDLTNASQYLNKFTLRNCIVRDLGYVGHGVHLTNPDNLDGFFCSIIADNVIHGGLWLENSGDSVYIERNTITGLRRGIFIKSVDGAAQVYVGKNNITTKGGAIDIARGMQIKIEYNQIEQTLDFVGETGSTINAQIVVGSSTYNIDQVDIIGNNINSHLGKAAHNIYVGKAYRTHIERNRLFVPVASMFSKGLYITSDAQKTFIHYNNMYEEVGVGELSQAAAIHDDGTGTAGIVKALTLETDFINAASSDYNAPGCEKTLDGIVKLQGSATYTGSAPVPANTTITVLPAGFRPQKLVRIPTSGHGTVSSVTLVVLVIDTAGNVVTETVTGSDTRRVDLEGVSFIASH